MTFSNTIANAANRPLNAVAGTLPDVSGALRNWFQPLTFGRVVKSVVGFQDVETETQVPFRGVVFPLTDRQISYKPEGQRAWTWKALFTDAVLRLDVDEIVIFHGKQTRIMATKNWSQYGFIEYHLVQDWTGSDPTTGIIDILNGGTSAFATQYENGMDGGSADVTGTTTIDGNG